MLLDQQVLQEITALLVPQAQQALVQREQQVQPGPLVLREQTELLARLEQLVQVLPGQQDLLGLPAITGLREPQGLLVQVLPAQREQQVQLEQTEHQLL